MFKLISFIAGAAIIAAVVAFALVFTPAVEASTPNAAVKGDRLDIRPARDSRPVRGACMQRGWPVLERECRTNHIAGLPTGLGATA